MSNPTRLQQRSPFRTRVHVRRNFPVLPPIGQSTPPPPPLSAQTETDSARSALSLTNFDVECQTPTEDPRDFWTRLHEHLDNEPKENQNYHGNQQTPNKVVRIFVSSTFTDFFNEREVLIKKVFPELRDEMEPMGIQIIDCDLRWGVPKDSTTEQTILTCLEEIDRCIEENGQPFFIGLLSDKYGWVPKMSSLPKYITERYRWIDGASITLMEFIHGALRSHNPNALFLIRNSESIFKNLPERYLDKFRDREEFNQKQIKELKIELPKMLSPEQVYNYDCFYNGLDSSTGRERVNISGLESFQKHAKDFLYKAIEKWYTEQFQDKERQNDEHQEMINFLLNKTQFFIECPNELAHLNRYITGDHEDFQLIEGEYPMQETHRPLMAFRGQSGSGKTILLSKLALYIEDEMKDKCLLFYYFLDGAFQDNASSVMLSQLKRELQKYLEENNFISPKTGLPLQPTDEKFVADAISLISIPIIIICDGLDKGDIHQTRKYHSEFPFDHLCDLFSDHTYIIVSCQSKSPLHETILYYPHYEFELRPWNIEQRRSYIEMFFRRFNKTLESEQKTLLINNKGGEHPFYLSCICENLRQFGDYSLVTQRLKAYPQNTEDLFNFLIDEAYSLANNQIILDAFFKLLTISEVGVLETDVVNMLHYHLNHNVEEEKQILINTMIWSTLRRQIKTFLDTTWIYGHQLITFRHSSLEKLLQNRLLKEDDGNENRALHRCLGEFYLDHSSLKQFSSTRVPFHFEHAQMYKEMIHFLRGTASRNVYPIDRRAYLQRRRCTKAVYGPDSMMNQRAYICNVCSMQFKLGPYTMSKSACAICTNMILGGNTNQESPHKREARLCQQHGYAAYPKSVQCLLCKTTRSKQIGATPSIADPVTLNICLQCWLAGRGTPRCCALEMT